MLTDKELIKAVQEAAGDDYRVYGELGRESDQRVALLALDLASNALLVLIVTAVNSADGATDLAVEVRTELDSGVPDAGAFCTHCGAKLRPWARFCGRCGTDATGRGGTGDTDVAQLRGAVEEAIAVEYELLGEMHRKEGGGAVFFARNRATRKIVALRLNRTGGTGEFELGETMILKKGVPGRPVDSAGSVSVTQILRKLDPGPAGSRSGGIPVIEPPRTAPRPVRPQFELDAAAAAPVRPQSEPRYQPTPARPAPAPPQEQKPPVDVGAMVRKGTPFFVGLGVVAVLAALAWAALTL